MSCQRIEEKEIDLDIELETVDSRVIRESKLFEAEVNFRVLFLAIFLAGLFLVVIIAVYNKYEEKKEIEEAKRYINEMNIQADRELKRIFKSVSPAPTENQKLEQKPQLRQEPWKDEGDAGLKSGEFYQADDGTWRNY